MSRSYAIDTNAAKAAESMSSRITETGKYVGVIVSAEAVKSKKGSDGIEFAFKDDSGATADFLTLWTHNGEGKELFSFKTLNALLTCCELRSIEPKPGQIEKWDADANARIKKDVTVFPALHGKRVGLLLQKAEYEKGDGSIGNKMEIFLPFQAATDRTAKEVLDKAQKAEALAKIALQLRDRPLAKKKEPAPAQSQASGAPFEDSDIPF